MSRGWGHTEIREQAQPVVVPSLDEPCDHIDAWGSTVIDGMCIACDASVPWKHPRLGTMEIVTGASFAPVAVMFGILAVLLFAYMVAR